MTRKVNTTPPPAAKRETTKKPASSGARSNAAKSGEVVLLSGGNPQIAKGDGDAPVQEYIAAMPGWKHDVAKRVDTLIGQAIPNVAKAVKWNSPFYGILGQGWFVNIHALTKYVKVTFFFGTSLDPMPPGGTGRSKEARWLDIYEQDVLDETQLTQWVKQAASLPGWTP
jgi:hypothetical protein